MGLIDEDTMELWHVLFLVCLLVVSHGSGERKNMDCF